MYLVNRSVRLFRGFLQSYGPERIKEKLWDTEFASGKWNFINNTIGDCVYPHLEKYARQGNILDLGCGPGNTANELNEAAYSRYLGVDISAEALAKAQERTEAASRTTKNRFVQSDFLSYEPVERFEIVLFRESMYHIPIGKIKTVIDKFASHLTAQGVFIVRMFTSEKGRPKHRPTKMIRIIESNYDVVEKCEYGGDTGATVIIFRPRRLDAKSPSWSKGLKQQS